MSQFGNKFVIELSGLAEVSKHLSHIVGTFRQDQFFLLRQLWSISAIVHVCHVRTRQRLDSGLEIHTDNIRQAVDCISAAVLFCLREAVPLVGFDIYI